MEIFRACFDINFLKWKKYGIFGIWKAPPSGKISTFFIKPFPSGRIFRYPRHLNKRRVNWMFSMFSHSYSQVATCSYVRYARLGGGQESKNAICILNMNMINDKVTIITTIILNDYWLLSWIGLHYSVVLARCPPCVWSSQDIHSGVSGLILHDQILSHEGKWKLGKYVQNQWKVL